MSLHRTYIWAASIFLLVPVIWVLLVPVNISVTVDRQDSLEIRNGDTLLSTWDIDDPHHDQQADVKVIISNSGSNGGVLEVALPVRENGTRMLVSEVEILSGNWEEISGGTALITRDADARLAFIADPTVNEIPFKGRPDSGTVTVAVDNRTYTTNLQRKTYEWAPYKLPSPKVARLTSIPSIVALKKLSFVGSISTAFELKVNLGAGDLLFYSAEMVSGRSVQFDTIQKISVIAKCLARFYSIMFLSLAFAVCFAFLSKGISRIIGLKGTFPFIMDVVIGMAITAFVSNTLIYFVNGRNAAPFVFLTMLAGILLALYSALQRGVPSVANVLRQPANPALIPTLVSILIVFLPIAIAGPQFLGAFRTDSFFYTTVPIALESSSLFELREAGSIIGFGMRSIDLSLISILSILTQLDTLTICLLLCTVCACVPIASAYIVVDKIFKNSLVSTISMWSVALSGLLSSLFFENYLVQFIFGAIVYANILAGYYLYQSIKDREPSLTSIWPYTVTGVFCFLLYPYFSITPFCVFLVIALLSFRLHLVSKVFVFVPLALVLLNIQLASILSFGAEHQFVDSLNNIAKYVVFPFYNDVYLIQFALGIVPYHGNAPLLEAIAQETQGGTLQVVLANYVMLAKQYFSTWFILTLILMYCYSIWRHRRFYTNSYGAVLPLAVCGHLILIFVAFKTSGIYAFGKLTWTLASTLPLLMLPCIIYEVTRRDKTGKELGYRRFAKLFMSGMLIVFVGINAVSKFIPTTLWLSNPNGSTMTATNLGVTDDLMAVRSLELCSNQRNYILKLDKGKSRQTQFYSVMAAHTYAQLHRRGMQCQNCTRSPLLLSYQYFNNDAIAENSNTVVFSLPIENGESESTNIAHCLVRPPA